MKKALKIIRIMITSVDPVTAAILGIFTCNIFLAVYILLGGENYPCDDDF